MLTHIAGITTSLATLWKITRTDGVVLGFTDHDEDIVYDGVTYTASTGFSATAIDSSSDLKVENLEIDSVLDSSEISNEDLRQGLYNNARIDVYFINYKDTSQGVIYMRRGFLGEVRVSRLGFTAELLGLVSKLELKIGDIYQASCRADLGDSACKVSINSYKFSGTVSTVTNSRRAFTDSSRTETDAYFNFGLLTWKTGNNAGKSIEVKTYTLSTKALELYTVTSDDIQVGDTYTIFAGCDRKFDTCKNKFDNLINFQGEPKLPGGDYILEPASKNATTT